MCTHVYVCMRTVSYVEIISSTALQSPINRDAVFATRACQGAHTITYPSMILRSAPICKINQSDTFGSIVELVSLVQKTGYGGMGTQLARFGETDAKPINPIYRRLDLGLSFAWWAFGTVQSNTWSHGKDDSVLGGSKLARTNKVIP